MSGFIPKLPRSELKRLVHTLDQIDSGGKPVLLQKWIDRQISRIGEDAFGRWIKAENKRELDPKTLIRFRIGLINLLPEEIHRLMIEYTQVEMVKSLVSAGFEAGDDFIVTNGLMQVTDDAREHLINEMPPEQKILAEKCFGTQAFNQAA